MSSPRLAKNRGKMKSSSGFPLGCPFSHHPDIFLLRFLLHVCASFPALLRWSMRLCFSSSAHAFPERQQSSLLGIWALCWASGPPPRVHWVTAAVCGMGLPFSQVLLLLLLQSMGLAFWGYRFCGFLSSSIPLGTLFFMDLEVLGTRAPLDGSSTRPLGCDSGVTVSPNSFLLHPIFYY